MLLLPLGAVEANRPLADYLVEPWSSTRNLPEETISFITQSTDGYLWLGTANGVLRLNGWVSTMLPWSAHQPLDRTVRCLTLDRRGTLWMMTARSGVLRATSAGLSPGADTVPERLTTLEPNLPPVPLTLATLHPLADGVRIVSGGGIYEMTSASRSGAAPTPVAKFPAVPVAAAAAPNGDIWLAAEDHQLWRWQPSRGWTRMAELPAGTPVRMIATADRVWLRGQGWIARWEKNRWNSWALTAEYHKASIYEQMLEDRQGVLWIGGRGEIARLHQNDLEFRHLGAPHEETAVTSLHEDREGVLWIGDMLGRLYRLRNASVVSYGQPEGLTGDVINSIFPEANGDIWIYALNKGLTRWHQGTFQRFPLPVGGNVWTMDRDRRTGDLILGGIPKLYRLAGARAIELPDPLRAEHGRVISWWHYPDGRGVLVSRVRGVFLQHSLTHLADARRFSAQPNIRSMTGSAEGTVWATSGRNLVQWSPAGEQVLRPPNLAEGTDLHALYWDTATARLWVGTAAGLLTWDPARQTWGELGLVTDSVFSIQRDWQGQLWLGTRNGLVSVDAAGWLAGRRQLARRLTREDGLRSLNFGMVRSQGAVAMSDGRMLFGSLRGLALIDPQYLPRSRFAPTLMIERIIAGDQPVPLKPPVELPPGTTRVLVRFDAFTVSTPKLIPVQYRLDGVDRDWQPKTDEREAQYANLGPGTYRFRLRAAGFEGQAGNEATVEWRIQAHFYETVWFRALAAALMLGLLAASVARRSARLQRRNDELSARVAERTQELETAKEAAEAASRAKAEFLATMSHELRTPMNGVLGLAQLLEQTPMNRDQQQMLGTLRSSAEALLIIVNDVLDLSKIEAGKLVLEQLPVRLEELTRDVLSLVRPLAQAKGLSLSVSADGPALEWLEGDPARLRQVLLNLVGNAIKFTNSGGVEVKISWGPEQVELAVADTGIGISPEKIPLLFQQFVQLDSSTTRLYGGTGLGLAIASRLVDAMGGTIACRSQTGEGSTFTVTLPAKPAAAPEAPASLAKLAPTPSPLKVLVAEDNNVNQIVIQGMLELFGVESVLAVNGAEAVERAQQEMFDLILMDCQMPVMDGYEATRQLRALLGESAPAVVAMTAHSLEGDRAACLAAGMTGHLSKPIRADELLRLLQAHQPPSPSAITSPLV